MKKAITYTSLAIISIAISIPVVFSDNHYFLNQYRQKSIGVANIENIQYKDECGSCHMAFQPGLLPSQSWEKIMQGLDNHFGDNAEVEKDVQKSINTYLIKNSAEKSNYRRSRKFIRNINLNNSPIRITKTPYFMHKHDEIPDKIVTNNQQVNSFSNCSACHSKAAQGLFDEHGVHIPGYGQWDD